MSCQLISLVVFCCLCLSAAPADPTPADARYLWTSKYVPADAIAARVAVPQGYERTPLERGSFADWLRGLPLKPGNPPVLLFNGERKTRQDIHAAVIDMDTGRRDLQQCADSIIRLRAEYLLSVGKPDQLHFNFTSGDRADFSKWAAGQRPSVNGNRVTWSKRAAADSSYPTFRAYLDIVFNYAGTVSLAKELPSVKPGDPIAPGDIFIQAGTPGHAVIVVDVATHPATGKTVFLLAQGYMPAQEMHILKNLDNPAISPWYTADFGTELKTPEWTFREPVRKRFGQ